MRKSTKRSTMILSRGEHSALVEALRRRSRFCYGLNPMESITRQWTGLGSATAYKAAYQAGLMEVATAPNPRCDTWWRLTERGARIVVFWIGQGYNYERIEWGDIPPYEIPDLIL